MNKLKTHTHKFRETLFFEIKTYQCGCGKYRIRKIQSLKPKSELSPEDVRSRKR